MDRPGRAIVGDETNLGKTFLYNFTRGDKLFEITNHLGNVNATFRDRKLPIPIGSTGIIEGHNSVVASRADFSPFGMLLPGRQNNQQSARYRYGFNGKEVDHEIWSTGNELDYGMRVYDPRVGRFLSVDPLQKQFPYFTPYQFAGNSPVLCIDLDGLEPKVHLNNWKHDYTWAKMNYYDDGFNNYYSLTEQDSKSRPYIVRTRTIGAYPYSITQYQYYDHDDKDYYYFTPTGFEPDYVQNLRDLENLGKFGKNMEKGIVAASVLWSAGGRALFQNFEIGPAIDKHGTTTTKERVMQIHKEADIPKYQKDRVITIAVADVEDSKGNKFRIVSLNSAAAQNSQITEAIDKTLKKNEIRVPNILGGNAHAEENLNEFTRRFGLTQKSVDVNRPFCASCHEQNRRNGTPTETEKTSRPNERKDVKPNDKVNKIKR